MRYHVWPLQHQIDSEIMAVYKSESLNVVRSATNIMTTDSSWGRESLTQVYHLKSASNAVPPLLHVVVIGDGKLSKYDQAWLDRLAGKWRVYSVTMSTLTQLHLVYGARTSSRCRLRWMNFLHSTIRCMQGAMSLGSLRCVRWRASPFWKFLAAHASLTLMCRQYGNVATCFIVWRLFLPWIGPVTSRSTSSALVPVIQCYTRSCDNCRMGNHWPKHWERSHSALSAVSAHDAPEHLHTVAHRRAYRSEPAVAFTTFYNKE